MDILSQILTDSQRFASDLAERLRERIYDRVVPELAQGIAAARNIENPSPEDLERIYEMALTALFCLLFIAYAEDRDLLPYRFNEIYRRRSLKQKAHQSPREPPTGKRWRRCGGRVAEGNREWGVPAYNGGLFTSDTAVSPAGAALAAIALPNETFEAALHGLLVDRNPRRRSGPGLFLFAGRARVWHNL